MNVQLVNSEGSLTPEGKKLQAFIENQFTEADQKGDTVALNRLSGHIGAYYVNVYKMKVLTPEAWMRDLGHSFARAAWRDLEFAEAQQAQAEAVKETSGQVSELAAKLDTLAAALADIQSQLNPVPQAETAPKKKAKPAEVPAPDTMPSEAESEA